jgi:Flp pilus assembly protein TadB
MRLQILVLYNFVAIGIAFAGLLVERRRPKLGIALLLVAVFMLINLLVGGAILFVPFIIALYAIPIAPPALVIWWLVRRRRRRRQSRALPAEASDERAT